MSWKSWLALIVDLEFYFGCLIFIKSIFYLPFWMFVLFYVDLICYFVYVPWVIFEVVPFFIFICSKILIAQAFVSIGLGYKISSCLTLMLRLAYFLRFCNLSYLGLITGCDVDIITAPVVGGKFTLLSISVMFSVASYYTCVGYLLRITTFLANVLLNQLGVFFFFNLFFAWFVLMSAFLDSWLLPWNNTVVIRTIIAMWDTMDSFIA